MGFFINLYLKFAHLVYSNLLILPIKFRAEKDQNAGILQYLLIFWDRNYGRNFEAEKSVRNLQKIPRQSDINASGLAVSRKCGYESRSHQVKQRNIALGSS